MTLTSVTERRVRTTTSTEVAPAVLADVRERLLDRAEDDDPLRARERVDVPAHVDVRVDAGAGGEGLGGAVDDLAERPRGDARRLERVGGLAQRAVELGEPAEGVVEPAPRQLPMALER